MCDCQFTGLQFPVAERDSDWAIGGEPPSKFFAAARESITGSGHFDLDAGDGVSLDAGDGVSFDSGDGVSLDAGDGVSFDSGDGVSFDSGDGVSMRVDSTVMSFAQRLVLGPGRVTLDAHSAIRFDARLATSLCASAAPAPVGSCRAGVCLEPASVLRFAFDGADPAKPGLFRNAGDDATRRLLQATGAGLAHAKLIDVAGSSFTVGKGAVFSSPFVTLIDGARVSPFMNFGAMSLREDASVTIGAVETVADDNSFTGGAGGANLKATRMIINQRLDLANGAALTVEHRVLESAETTRAVMGVASGSTLRRIRMVGVGARGSSGKLVEWREPEADGESGFFSTTRLWQGTALFVEQDMTLGANSRVTAGRMRDSGRQNSAPVIEVLGKTTLERGSKVRIVVDQLDVSGKDALRSTFEEMWAKRDVVAAFRGGVANNGGVIEIEVNDGNKGPLTVAVEGLGSEDVGVLRALGSRVELWPGKGEFPPVPFAVAGDLARELIVFLAPPTLKLETGEAAFAVRDRTLAPTDAASGVPTAVVALAVVFVLAIVALCAVLALWLLALRGRRLDHRTHQREMAALRTELSNNNAAATASTDDDADRKARRSKRRRSVRRNRD